MGTFFLVLLLIVSMFLMFVVLIQRGRGGGLAGAFGGAGGQSAFGTKAGDLFTWITVWTGIVWVLLAILAGWRLRVENEGSFVGGADRGDNAEIATPAGEKPEGQEPGPNPDPEIKPAAIPTSTTDLPKGKTAPATGTSTPAATGTSTPAATGTSTPAKAPVTTPAKADASKTPAVKSEPGKSEPAKSEPAKTETKTETKSETKK